MDRVPIEIESLIKEYLIGIPFDEITAGGYRKIGWKNSQGELIGKYKIWYPSESQANQIMAKGVYRNGKKHGKFKTWYRNGQLEYKKNWKDGELHGKWKWWHINGTLQSVRNYSEGCLHIN